MRKLSILMLMQRPNSQRNTEDMTSVLSMAVKALVVVIQYVMCLTLLSLHC